MEYQLQHNLRPRLLRYPELYAAVCPLSLLISLLQVVVDPAYLSRLGASQAAPHRDSSPRPAPRPPYPFAAAPTGTQKSVGMRPMPERGALKRRRLQPALGPVPIDASGAIVTRAACGPTRRRWTVGIRAWGVMWARRRGARRQGRWR